MKSLLLFIITAGFVVHGFSQSNDSTAIVKLLENDSATWRSGDSTAHANCWQIEPYGTVIIIPADGKAFAIPVEKMAHASPASMGKGGSSSNENYTMSIHGNTALVTHKETSIAADGSITYTFEAKTLEKLNGQWKLTSLIVQVL